MNKPQLVAPQRPRKPRTLPTSTEWYSPKDAAKHLGIGVSLVYAACAAGHLKCVRFGHSTIRIRPAWVEAWAESLAR